MKTSYTHTLKLVVAFGAALVFGVSAAFAASSAKQLAKAKALYEENKDDEAMDYFIDVLVNGTRSEVEEANRYINLIHNRVGGIQDPIEVDINFAEGNALHLGETVPLSTQDQDIVQEVQNAGLSGVAYQDADALLAQQAAEAAAAAQAAGGQLWLEQQANQEIASEKNNSTFTDLTSPAAITARQIYTSQKLESLKNSVMDRLTKMAGVRVYMRNDLPDAIDIDSEVLFNGYKFRPEALPLLDDIYTLMALTQGAGYIILPPGSYTDNITLSGIRQAMALNSFFVHKGLSSGRLSYNMGLFDQEPPAKFANLDGLSIVFDFDADLPASLPQATSISKQPLLSMAVVPVSNKIDPAAGETFVVEFSVIETANPIENWVFQVVQHAANGGYYVVRQLEGFAPVYHQIVWNGRKGIIGPEMACGTYTFVLTAVDSEGAKRTVRRQVEVACNAGATAAKNAASGTADETGLNYKTARLWTKPGRVMKAAADMESVTVSEPEIVDPFAVTDPGLDATDPYAVQGSALTPAVDPAQAYGTQTYSPVDNSAYGTSAQAGVSNPYDMPYEDYN